MASKICENCRRSAGKDRVTCAHCGGTLVAKEAAGTPYETLGPATMAEIAAEDRGTTVEFSATDAADATEELLPGVESPVPAPPAEAMVPARESTHYIEVLTGPSKGQRHEITVGGPIVVGTGGEAGCRIEGDDYVSRRHAALTLVGDKPFVEDLGSTNGGMLRVSGRRQLADGDLLILSPSTALRIVKE